MNGVIVNASWYTSISGGPAEPWRLDLASLSTHETGHPGGWTQHFEGSQCAGLAQPTMCETPTGGNTWWRSLPPQGDRQNVSMKYP